MLRPTMIQQKSLAVALLATIYFAPGALYLAGGGGARDELEAVSRDGIVPPLAEARLVAAAGETPGDDLRPAASPAPEESDKVSGCPFS